MSNINIERAVENIRAITTVYTPVVEIIINALQAIDDTKREDGRVSIRVIRSQQTELKGALPEIIGFKIQDNGVGFTDNHRNSFDTLYTDCRITEGGKGFGRFICLKYFNDLKIKSVYRTTLGFKLRRFSMGKKQEIIVNEEISDTEQDDTGTVVTLSYLKSGPTFEKKLTTVAKNIVERILPFFIADNYICPEIVLGENDYSQEIRLNDFVSNQVSAYIREFNLHQNTFKFMGKKGEECFLVRVFKIYAPKSHKSRISLVAHKREVSGSTLHKYIPEFEEEFYEKNAKGGVDLDRNYIIKAYVFGKYLDENVSLERGGFEFSKESDLLHGIAQVEIEKEVASIALHAVGEDISLRQEKKLERVKLYVAEEAPWHQSMLIEIDLSQLPYKPTNEEIETQLQKQKFTNQNKIRSAVEKLLSETNIENIEEKVIELAPKISESSKDELIHYVAMRKSILDLLEKSLQADEFGAYPSEGVVHDIIFPRKHANEDTPFHSHNLWIVDERLNYTTYVSSDLPLPLSQKGRGRPDLLVYNKRVLFRGDNEASNPITIFEFKKPQRDDFVNPSANEDPVQQIVRYVNAIQNGKFKTPRGRNIRVENNTPFYGYVVCDLTNKIELWLEKEKNFTPMPDRLGWFHWMGNIKLYVEVVSWDKILKDAQMRNKVFFEKLGI